MNILLCGASMGIGGAETHILSLALALSARGHRVAVAGERGELCEELKRSGVRFIRVPLSSTDARSVRRSYLILKKILLRWDFDVVHAHSRLSSLIVSMIRRKEGLDFRFVVTAHAKYKTSRALRLLSVWGDRCIAVSKDIKSHLVKNYGVPDKRVCVIPNGIDTKRFSPVHKGNHHSILFVSRLDEDCSRGARLLCEIAPRLCREFPDATVTIAGGGDDVGGISFLAKRANVRIGRKCISLVGKCSDMPSLIARHSLVVGVSRVALEALAMEKPVILLGNEGALGLFNEKNLSCAVNTNFTCRGYGKRFSAERLLSEIKKAFTMDGKSRTRLVRFGRKVVEKKYSLDKVADMTLRVYKYTPKKTPHILIGGYYGFGNLGDESVLSAITEGLKARIPDCRISALTNKGCAVKGIAGISFVDRGDLFEVIGAMRRSDVYISGGGSLFQNKTSNRSLMYYCELLRLAKRFDNKCVILANGIGPLRGKNARRLAARALCLADYVSVRDMDSFLSVLSLTKGKVSPRLSADPVFLNDENDETNSRHLLSVGVRYAAISLRGKKNEALICAIDKLCKNRRIFPVFVPMDTKKDKNICKLAARATGGIFVNVRGIEAVRGILKNAEFAIGERLHFLLFALKYHIPIVPISSDPKIDSLSFELFGESAIDVSERDGVGDISEKIEKYIAENDISQQKSAIYAFSERIKKDMDEVAKICLFKK